MTDEERLRRRLQSWDPVSRTPAGSEQPPMWLRSRLVATARDSRPAAPPAARWLTAMVLVALLGATTVAVLLDRAATRPDRTGTVARLLTIEPHASVASDPLSLPEGFRPPSWLEPLPIRPPGEAAAGHAQAVGAEGDGPAATSPPRRRRVELVAAGGTRVIWSIEVEPTGTDSTVTDAGAARLR